MRYILLYVTLGLALFLGIAGLFTVHETQRAIVLRLGKIELTADGQPKIISPGIHFKVPFIDNVRYFDTRLQTLSIESSRILTHEKKDMIVDLFVKWRINDLPAYFTRTGGDKRKAERLLQEQVGDGIRAEFGKRTVREVVSGERQEIMDRLQVEANRRAKEFGLEVVDARIKRIDFPPEVSEKIFERMRTERQRVATEHRAHGRSKAEIVRAESDARVTILLAQAQEKSRRIRGEGDALAAAIYGKAYSADPEFYRFYRSLEAYRETFVADRDILVLKPEGQFFDYFARAK